VEVDDGYHTKSVAAQRSLYQFLKNTVGLMTLKEALATPPASPSPQADLLLPMRPSQRSTLRRRSSKYSRDDSVEGSETILCVDRGPKDNTSKLRKTLKRIWGSLQAELMTMSLSGGQS
jgi:hypothetical protein